MNKSMVYLVLDCYPKVNSHAFERFVGAAVGCWVRADVCAADQNAGALAQERLSAEGWVVVRTVVNEKVSPATYAAKAEGREHFEQAQVDGFVAHFHLRRRESVGAATESNPANPAKSLVNTAHEVSLNGGVSLFSAQDQQWANGVTPDGDEFLPIWPTDNDAVKWLEFWPGYELRDLSAESLPDLLDQVDSEGMWIGLGIGSSVVTMCHAGWIKELILRRETGTNSSAKSS